MIDNLEQFYSLFNVSRETKKQISIYVDLLLEWNKNINLIAKTTQENIFMRHIVDCGQILRYINFNEVVTDVGSGAGLPCIVLSILGVKKIYLIESDGRKVKFLKEASLISNNEIHIIYDRIENIKFFHTDVITARAVAPMSKLLKLTNPLVSDSNRRIFYKGRNVHTEIDDVKSNKFNFELIPSLVESDSWLVKVDNLR